jgi:hypothetical protein
MRILRWFSLAILAVAVTGCIKVDQTMTLEKDGSGTLVIRYGMSEQALAQIEAMEQMSEAMGEEGNEMDDDTPFDFDFDEKQVREDFEAQNIDGVELLSAASESMDGWRYMQLELAFDNLAALSKTDFFEDNELSLTKDAEGNYVLNQRSGDDEIVPDGDPAEQQQMMKQMAAMFAGMRLANQIIVPTEIVETNATDLDGNKAAWIYEVDKDPSVLTKLENLNMRVVFSSDGLSIPEL